MKKLLLILLILSPAPALAEFCDDLWFTRNLIIDRAGYCFGSKLGQSVFDNGDCIGKSVSLSAAANKQVAAIRKQETANQCKVNTGRTALDLEDIDIRRKLTELPIRDELESGCIGWRDGVTPLRAGRGPNSPVVGRIENGDDVLFSHIFEEGGSYVTVRTSGSGGFKSAGWLLQSASESSCRLWAG